MDTMTIRWSGRRPNVVMSLSIALAFVQCFLWSTSSPAASLSADVPATVLAAPPLAMRPTTSVEDSALKQSLANYSSRSDFEDESALVSFLQKYPHSGWASALWLNLGISYQHEGYFSRAINAWRNAWSEGRDATDPHARALVNAALGDLVQAYASFGQFDKVKALFAEVGGRPITGSATEQWQNAAEQLRLSGEESTHLFNCGPDALRNLLVAINPKNHSGDFLLFRKTGAAGSSLAQLATLADQVKLQYRLIFRAPGQAIPALGIVHWKLGHYAAVVGFANGRYHIVDQSFPGDGLWVKPAAIEAEASGYFLVPKQGVKADASGWRDIGSDEAATVWGKGSTNNTNPGGHPNPCSGLGCYFSFLAGGGNGLSLCMCSYGILESTVAVSLQDTPVGYRPPVGPSARVSITYDQREDSQPPDFTFSNLGQKWSLSWTMYVVDDPNTPGATVSRYAAGGGAYYYTGYNSANGQFRQQEDDGSFLVLISSSPIIYKRYLADGSIETYSQSNGRPGFPRYVFLSSVADPQGNILTVNYDWQNRITSLTDATGRSTTFSYTVFGQPYLITKITDPFGRSAKLTYDSSGRLSSITDTIGVVSSFTYDANSLVNSLITPYGTTSFAYTAPGTSGPPRFVDVTDPMNFHEREEWLEPAPIADSDPSGTVPVGMPRTPTNQYLSYRDSFHWDKSQYVAAGCSVSGGCDYSKATDTHFLHVAGVSGVKAGVIESVKYPLENRIWYQYANQPSAVETGSFDSPTAVARVLDNGSTQIAYTFYDTAGFYKPIQTIDPVGRITNYTYTNLIDLAGIAQDTENGFHTTIAQFIYNNHHRPIFATDASGRTTAFVYNTAGQRTSVTNALGQTTSYSFNPSGDLVSVTNANSVMAAAYTYDSFDRVATFTDSEGWVATYTYDNADRVTSITYPDGTKDIYRYAALDLVSHTDRLSRTTSYLYDADRRLTSIVNADGTQTLFGYNQAGQVISRTDPGGNTTQFAYDIEGRLETKTYPDTSTLGYAYENTTSRLHTITDALSQVKTYTYTQDNRVDSISYTGAVNPTPNVSFTYDPYFPRIATTTDGTGTTAFAYVPVGVDGALKKQSETTPYSAGTLTYTYDALGRVLSRTVQGSSAETFTYDAIGRLVTHTSDLGSFTLAYLGQTNQISSRALASSSLATTWSYLSNTADRRLQQVSTAGLSAGQFSTFAFGSNAVGQVTGLTQTSDATIPYPSSSTSQSASYNNLNQSTSVSGTSYSYDADGNLTSDGARNYAWDAENRLVGITYIGVSGKATSFTYDLLGRRATISSTPAGGGSTTTTTYLWCGGKLCQARNASSSVTRSYYAEGEYAPGVSSTSYYYAPDNVGSVRRAFTSASAPTYDYDPYGAPLQVTAPVTDFTYARLFYNSDSGLYFGDNRAFNPFTGRWLSRDPIGESGDSLGNLYAYAAGNPVNLTDPNGLCISPLELGLLVLGTEILGGGPEDPIADELVAEELDLAFAGDEAIAAETAEDATLSSAPAETYFRTMSQEDFGILQSTGSVPATSETFISPSLEAAQQYEGVTVQVSVNPGTTNALLNVGVRNAGLTWAPYAQLPLARAGWTATNAFFKLEEGVVNVGLGRGTALNLFNANIVDFTVVP